VPVSHVVTRYALASLPIGKLPLGLVERAVRAGFCAPVAAVLRGFMAYDNVVAGHGNVDRAAIAVPVPTMMSHQRDHCVTGRYLPGKPVKPSRALLNIRSEFRGVSHLSECQLKGRGHLENLSQSGGELRHAMPHGLRDGQNTSKRLDVFM